MDILRPNAIEIFALKKGLLILKTLVDTLEDHGARVEGRTIQETLAKTILWLEQEQQPKQPAEGGNG